MEYPDTLRRLTLGIATLFALTVASCDDGNSDSGGGGGGGTMPFDASLFVGSWLGAWTNDTFSTTGTATATVSESGGILTVVLDLDGNVFGSNDPPAETFEAQIIDAQAILNAVASTTYGQVDATLISDGTLTAQGDAVPAAGVASWSLTGRWDMTEIVVDVQINFSAGSPATATATLNRQ